MYDVFIIGSGAAGLTLALSLPDTCKVAVLSKDVVTEGSTVYAQGGVSAVLDATDSVDSHVADTLNAGAGLCDEQIVRFTAENGAKSINWLLDAGVPFTRDEEHPERLHLTREGGHSHRRIAHAADASGAAIEYTLVEQVQQRPNITILEFHIAIDLITSRKLGHSSNRCIGAYVYNR